MYRVLWFLVPAAPATIKFIITPELYATNYRTLGLGSANLWTRIGGASRLSWLMVHLRTLRFPPALLFFNFIEFRFAVLEEWIVYVWSDVQVSLQSPAFRREVGRTVGEPVLMHALDNLNADS